MVTVFSALYAEARGLMEAFRLKKENGQKHFQVFSDADRRLRLVITGVGMIPAAAAVAEISTMYPPQKGDVLVNFGSCGATGVPVGELCLGNKITEVQTGRTYYPDMFYRHPFSEAEILTDVRAAKMGQYLSDGAKESPVDAGDAVKARRLYDMEAAAVYRAGNYYYGPHQMLFLKAVTDNGVNGRDFSREQFGSVMEQASLKAVPFLRFFLEKEGSGEEDLRKEVEKEAGELGKSLHCSAVMQAELTQLLYYCALSGIDWRSLCPAGAAAGGVEKPMTKDKREGKRILEELKAGLLQSQF